MKIKTNYKWLIKIVLISVVASMVFTFASKEILGLAGYLVALAVLAVFVIIGVVFDVIGVAVTSSAEAPFHSMAAHHERGAVESIQLIKNADKVSSICNDVVGDVTGIISGTTAALIAARFMEGMKNENFLFSLLVLGVVTGLTVGGKSIGKTIAINNNTIIVLRVGKLINMFHYR